MGLNRFALPALLLVAAVLAGATPARAQCAAPAGWFPHSATPEPVFDKPFTSNCDFHTWAWQEFLWLTQDTAPNHPRFLDLPRADDLFAPGRAPVSFAMVPKGREMMLKPRTNKTEDPTHFGEIRQAGSKGILVDQKGRSVYYLSQVNQTYYTFIRSNGLHVPDTFKAKAPGLSFPVHSLELKSSWMVVPAGTTANGFFTIAAQINPLKCKNGEANCKGDDVVVDFDQSLPATVALVGFHVVGVVQGHPEFVWATFEHNNNAPDIVPDGTNPKASTFAPASDFTFYKANTPANVCNDSRADSVALVPATQALSPPTNVIRQFVLGGGDAEDSGNVTSLNAGVRAGLLAENSVWANYSLRGGVWLPDPQTQLKPGATGNQLRNRAVGSVSVANSTMETFDQGLKKNCFACHDAAAQPLISGAPGLPASNLNLSHILGNGLLQRLGSEAAQTTGK
ncbi:MAG: hypothetical protein LC745_01850 [Planctomycetia bacterium]|nr:hypothetical protein [Planctomycetia bacterium]